MELIQRNYSFRKMKNKVAKYIKKCVDCQKNKHSTHAPYREMQALELPNEPWTNISMDFITGLPKSKDPVISIKYDSILVVICRLTKAIEVILFRRDYNATQLGNIINDRVIRYHRILKIIISD
jgi:hypothetical protein